MNKSESRRKAASLRQRQIRSKAFSPQADSPRPLFVADVMLGRLAKWLRIAGFDVLYSNRFTDDELVALSRQEGRILLSRDTRLLVRRAVERFIFLESETIQSQLKQVFQVTRTTCLPGILTRCLSCNDALLEIPREKVRGKVPAFVYETQASFKCCPKCGRIYWAGTHRQSILRTFEKLICGPIISQRPPRS
ncbi:MAG: Mut7-C RNAse domain-containing protein [Acidobacteriia bacterium]|nr:Mut7-C RNAse domain-containing protein [Terriglobia bacterium]